MRATAATPPTVGIEERIEAVERRLERIETRLDQALSGLAELRAWLGPVAAEPALELREGVTCEQAADEIFALLHAEHRSMLPSELMALLRLPSDVVLDALARLAAEGSVAADREESA